MRIPHQDNYIDQCLIIRCKKYSVFNFFIQTLNRVIYWAWAKDKLRDVTLQNMASDMGLFSVLCSLEHPKDQRKFRSGQLTSTGKFGFV